MKNKLNTILRVFIVLIGLNSCTNTPDIVPEQYLDFCSQIHRNDSVELSNILKPLEQQMQNKTGVLVLEDGGNAMMARAWLSEYAEKTIDVQYFIFATDNVGLIACDYLVRAADRGVKVRLLIDDIMVDAGIKDIITLASHPNIEIKIYNPGINLGKNLVQKLSKFATDFTKANQRMHNKTFTVDGKICITGGRNIADEYFDFDHDYNFRDRDILLMGKKVTDVSNSFDGFWNNALSVPVEQLAEDKDTSYSPNNFDRLHQYACNPSNFWPQVRSQISQMPELFQSIQNSGNFMWLDSVYFIADKPGKLPKEANGVFSNTTQTLMELVMKAKKSIVIQSPYLITTEVGQELLSAAIKRGVSIKILTNSMASTDNMDAFSGYQRSRKDLLNTGVRIFEFKPDAAIRYEIMTGALQEKLNFQPIFGLHAKSMVIDENITVVGTFNFDPRSAYRNTECVTVVYSSKIAQKVLKGIEEEMKPQNAWETTLNFNPDKEASKGKQIKTLSRKIVPKGIL
ncbi:MAG: phospholipase D family protein [Bacteroidia bacterium]|nr:phospholipase D family protein [Bacteroidia bacterium]MCF8426479.1 phospholipase D family protein [Bacteroidia bacterium]